MEAVALGDWMAVMVEGRIRQAGPVQEVFRHPADAQVAESVGVENVLPPDRGSRIGLLVLAQVGAAELQCVDTGETGRSVRLHPRGGRGAHAGRRRSRPRARATGWRARCAR